MKLLLICALLLSGCTSLRATDVVQPREVTLEQALLSIGCGLKSMDEAQGVFRTGLFASEVEVKLSLSAAASESGKLTLLPLDVGNGAKLGHESVRDSKTERSNTISIKFTNVLGVPPTALVSAKSPDEIRTIFETLKGVGIASFDNDRFDYLGTWKRCE